MWHFYSAALSHKIEKTQEQYNDSYSNYSRFLLKAEQPTMEVIRLRRLAMEVFKTLKSLNPGFMHTYFKKDSRFAKRKNELVVNSNRAKTGTFDGKSLRTLGAKIWNSLPEDVKDLTAVQKFTELKHGTDLNANGTSANTHITILELHTLA